MLFNDQLEARVVSDMFSFNYPLYLRVVSHVDGVRRFAWPSNSLEFKTEDPLTPISFGEVRSPVARLSETALQVLMDDLWNCGIRPSEGSGSAGAFAAQGKHLEDLRALVARNSGVDFK